MLPDEGYYNPYETSMLSPLLRVSPGNAWSDIVDQRQGIWALDGGINISIPNWPEQRPEKEIWLQVTWKQAGFIDCVCDQPTVGVATDPLYDTLQMCQIDTPAADGWTHTLFKINIFPNPNEECISITGDIFLDQVVVDTNCIPEPASFVLIGGGALLALRRRRNVLRNEG